MSLNKRTLSAAQKRIIALLKQTRSVSWDLAEWLFKVKSDKYFASLWTWGEFISACNQAAGTRYRLKTFSRWTQAWEITQDCPKARQYEVSTFGEVGHCAIAREHLLSLKLADRQVEINKISDLIEHGGSSKIRSWVKVMNHKGKYLDPSQPIPNLRTRPSALDIVKAQHKSDQELKKFALERLNNMKTMVNKPHMLTSAIDQLYERIEDSMTH